MSSEQFAAERRAAQDDAVGELRPVIADALAGRDSEADTAWIAPVIAAVMAIYAARHAEESGGLPTTDSAGFESSVRSSLQLTSLPDDADQLEDQVERLALWLAVAAQNAATLEGSQQTGRPFVLEWVTMQDEAVRDAHRGAQGQRRLPGQTFNIAGYPFAYPGQPVGPPDLWLGCRCVLRVVDTEEAMLTAAVGPDYKGGMVALKPSHPEDFVAEGGDPPEDLHVTMFFLGDDVSTYRQAAIAAVRSGARRAAGRTPVTAQVAGVGRLGDADPPATVLFLNGDDLEPARNALMSEMWDYGSEDFPPQHQPWIPHMTLGYGLNAADYEHMVGREVVLDQINVHLGGDVETYQREEAEETLPEVPAEAPPATEIPWSGVLTVEGMESGDGRMFAEGALTWRDLPLPLMWQKTSGEGHSGSVVVGRIDQIWREGAQLHGRGAFADTPEADEVISLIAEGHLRGISVDVDKAAMQFDEDSDVTLFHQGRISGATIVPIPAFMEVTIQLGEYQNVDGCPEGQHRMPDGECMPDDEMASAAAELAVTDKEWDGSSSRFTPEQWRDSTVLHREPAEGQDPLTKELHSLPIREPNGDLNRNAVHAAAARINQVTDASEEEISAAKRRLRSAYDELDEDPPEVLEAASFKRGPGWVTHPEETNRLHNYWVRGEGAAKIGWGTEGSFRRCRRELAEYIGPQYLNRTCAEWYHDATGRWPGRRSDNSLESTEGASMSLTAAGMAPLDADLFKDPKLDSPTPLTVDGKRVFGHLALWGTCHTGFDGICRDVPASVTDYSYFTLGSLPTTEGEVRVGQITINTGHAGEYMGPLEAASHYDHTGTAAADVTVGEDEFGVWFSGALRDIDEKTERALRAAKLSGDWRRIGGNLELVAALAVNVPGFPVPRVAAGVEDGRQLSLVAAGILQDADFGTYLRRQVAREVTATSARMRRAEAARKKMRVLRAAAARRILD